MTLLIDKFIYERYISSFKVSRMLFWFWLKLFLLQPNMLLLFIFWICFYLKEISGFTLILVEVLVAFLCFVTAKFIIVFINILILFQVRVVCWKWVRRVCEASVCVFRGDGPLTPVLFGIGDQTTPSVCLFQLVCVRIACDVALRSSSSQWLVVLKSHIWWWVCLSTGRAGEAAAAGQSHPRSLRQRQDRQERQLLSIRKTHQHLHTTAVDSTTQTYMTVYRGKLINDWKMFDYANYLATFRNMLTINMLAMC